MIYGDNIIKKKTKNKLINEIPLSSLKVLCAQMIDINY